METNKTIEHRVKLEKNQRILVVEDEYLLGEEMLSKLERLGFSQIELAYDSAEALKHLEHFKPDLILLDIQLGDNYDGLKLARKLRYDFDVPFIFTSSHTGDKIVEEAKTYQPYGYLVKPINKESLRTAIEMALYKAAYEDVSQQERERRLLLELSRAFASVRETADLFRVLIDTLRPLIKFDEALINVWEQGGEKLRCLLYDPAENHVVSTDYLRLINSSFKAKNTPYEQIWEFDKPTLLNLQDIMKEYPDFPCLATSAGFVADLVLPLHFGNEKVGVFELIGREKSQLLSLNQELLKGIADQLGIAVSNILAYEKIVARQRINEMLLRLRDIFLSNSTWETQVIQFGKYLYEEVPFKHLILDLPDLIHPADMLVLEHNGGAFRTKTLRNLDEIAQVTPDEAHHYFNSVKEEYLSPKIFDSATMDMVCERYSYKRKYREAHQHYSQLIVPFVDDKITIRIAFFSDVKDQYSESHLDKIQTLLPDLAMAIEKKFLIDQLTIREREKETLLGVSKVVTDIRSKEDLSVVIQRKVREYIAFDEANVLLFNSREQSFDHFLTVVNQKSIPALLNTQTGSVGWELTKKPYQELIEIDFHLTELSDWLLRHQESHAAAAVRKKGFRYAFNILLQSGDRTIGTLLFYFLHKPSVDSKLHSLIRGIANQISLAVQNIQHNEEILRREREKALQVRISEIITSTNQWQDRFRKMIDLLEDLVPFDCISFVIGNRGKNGHDSAFEKIAFDEYRPIDSGAFFQQMGIGRQEYEQERTEYAVPGTAVYNGADFTRLTEQYKVKRAIAERYHIQSHLSLRCELAKEGKFNIAFYSKQADAYKASHTELMGRLLESMIHPLEKMLAYAEIEKLNELLKQEKDYLEEEIKVNYNFEEIVGTSKELQAVFQKVSQVAYADTTVMIFGESGTGKELIARAIHNLSPRNNKPLVKLNCATLPPQLLESELFGHERGAFTGADKQRLGKFELSHKGTIFLDEIGEMPVELQAKLLRVLQEREFERLGGNTVIKTDVRIIAATNRNLEKAIADGKFRADLFFRLNVFPLTLPPLRERKEDITSLALHFLQKSSRKLGKKITGISSASLKELMAYSWPGNVRELEHIIERAVIVNKGNTLNLTLDKMKVTSREWTEKKGPFQFRTLREAERELILNTLRFCGGRVRGSGGAAEILDINPATLDSRMKKLGIEKQHVFKDI